MNNYLLNCNVKEQIYEKLIQIKAIAGLINEVTSPEFDGENEKVNTAAWLISEQLEIILLNIEKLPLQGN